MSRYITFDVKTPSRFNNRMNAIGITIIEVGAITRKLYSFINPETNFEYFNTQLTGISEKALHDKPAFSQIRDKIESIMNKRYFGCTQCTI